MLCYAYNYKLCLINNELSMSYLRHDDRFVLFLLLKLLG